MVTITLQYWIAWIPPAESPVCDHRNITIHGCTNTKRNIDIDTKDDDKSDKVNEKGSTLLIDRNSSAKKIVLRGAFGVVTQQKPKKSNN